MKQRFLIVCISLFCCILVMGPMPHSAIIPESISIIIVDNEGDGDYRTITDAIHHANPGDHIQIYSGQYNETLTINKSDITLEGINYEIGSGNDDDYPFINGNHQGNVIEIKAPRCTIQGLIIYNSGTNFFQAGIFVESDSTCLDGNGIFSNHYGILCNNCSKNTIRNNHILSNTMDGMFLGYTWDNTITNNVIKENGFQGIYGLEVWDTTIDENTIFLNALDGIHLFDSCHQNKITNNEIHSNGIDGIKIKQTSVSDNTISKNTIYSNAWNGIHIMKGTRNTISENTLELNLRNGLHIGNADSNYIIRNIISDNKNHGIEGFSRESSGNHFYYNNINDYVIDQGTNIWDDGIETGGNHWTSYTGSDENNDGIGDTPVTIDGNGNMDNHPFMEPFYPPATPTKPSATITMAIETDIPFTTTTTDSQYNQVQYGWDWDDDLVVDEWTPFYQPQEPVETIHRWDINGTYVIRVKAMDNYGFQSDWSHPLTITLEKHKSIHSGFDSLSDLILTIINWWKNLLFPD